MKEKNPLLLGAVSGGITALIMGIIFVNFSPKLEDSGYASVVSSEEEKTEIAERDSNDPGYVGQEEQVIKAVKKAVPAVVSVIITKDVPVLEQYYEEGSDPFGNFFGGPSPFSFRVPQYRQKGTEKKEIGGGSGFVVSEDGYIVTNKHVVSDENAEYTVFMGDDAKKYTAKVVATDPVNDVAILKIEASGLPFLEFADSDALNVGQTAIAIGNPLLEFNNSVSVGVVSGLSRSITAGDGAGMSEQLEGVIQTDAAINPGNSGGPLLNLSGKVIGVNVAVASAENIGFALPSNLVKNDVNSVKEHGKIVRPYLGIRYTQINEQIKEANKLDTDYGALVLRGEKPEELAVMPGSPADKAGLLENDIILEVDGKKLDKDTSLSRYVARKNVGDILKLKVLSKGKEKMVEVKLEEIKN